jgi:hypothetical protein
LVAGSFLEQRGICAIAEIEAMRFVLCWLLPCFFMEQPVTDSVRPIGIFTGAFPL